MEMAAQEPEPLSSLRARLGRRLRVLMEEAPWLWWWKELELLKRASHSNFNW